MSRCWYLLVVLLVITNTGHSQEAEKPRALFRLLTEVPGKVTGLTFSTDGLNLAYTSEGNIFRLSLKDPTPIATAATSFREYEPQWSPDATKIAYQKDSAGRASIWIYDIAIDEHNRVTAIKENTFNPSWALHGKAIAFSSDTYGSVDVMIKDFETGKERRLTAAKGDEYCFGFHPNGRFVGYYERNTEEEDIYAVTLTGKEEYPLTRTLEQELAPTWSYDGTRVIYYVLRGNKKVIYTADFPYGESNQVGDFDVPDIDPIISTNGNMVIYPIRSADGLDLELYILDTKERMPLQLGAIDNLGQPVWSLGGRILALSAYDEAQKISKIWLLNISPFLKRDR